MFTTRDKGLNVNRYLLLIGSASVITIIILFYIVNNILIHRPVAGFVFHDLRKGKHILSFKNNGPLSRELQALFPRNLIHDPQYTLDRMLVLKCFFCNGFKTPIEYDMKVHLRYIHRKELVPHLPIQGKGFDMDYNQVL